MTNKRARRATVGLPGAFLRRKQRGFPDADGWLAVMPARMAEAEASVVYVIHFLRSNPDDISLAENTSHWSMLTAAVRAWFV